MRAAITCFIWLPFLFSVLGFLSPSWHKHHLLFRHYCLSHTFHSHLCETLHSAVRREAHFYSCAVPAFPLTGQISDRPGRLSYILLTNRVHAGERMCEQLNRVNRGIFRPTNDLRGKHDSAFKFVSERERERLRQGGERTD